MEHCTWCGMSEDRIIDIELPDVYGEARPLKAKIHIDRYGVSFSFVGYGDCLTADGYGQPLLVENRYGIPYVVVWGDINQEDPTLIAGLESAAEAKRQVEAE